MIICVDGCVYHDNISNTIHPLNTTINPTLSHTKIYMEK